MNEIIKNIEAAQLKAEAPAFNVGDTVKVLWVKSKKETAKEFRSSREQFLKDRVEAPEKLSQ